MSTEDGILAAAREEHPAAVERLTVASQDALNTHNGSSDPIKAIDEAIKLGYESLKFVEPPHPCRCQYLALLSAEVKRKYNLTRNERDIRQLLFLNRETIRNIPKERNILRAKAQVNHAYSLVHDLPGSMGPDNLKEAINTLQEATQYIDEGSEDYHRILADLSICFLMRYQHKMEQGGLDTLDDLDAALSLVEKAVEAASTDLHPVPPAPHDLIAWLYEARHRSGKGVDEDIFQALKHAETALSLSMDESKDRTERAAKVGSLRLTKFEKTNDLVDLLGAIDVLSGTLETTGRNNPYREQILHDLAAAWRKKYAKWGNTDDLTRARDAAYRVVAEGSLEQPHNLIASWAQLSDILLAAYDLSEDVYDLELSTVAAMNGLQADHSTKDKPSLPMHLISRCLRNHYRRTKDVNMLKGAIYMEYSGHINSRRFKDGRHRRARDAWDHWTNLLEDWARVTRSTSVLQDAIKIRQSLVRVACSPTCYCGAAITARLGLVHLLDWGYSESSLPEYLEEALERSEEALEICPGDHPSRAACYVASHTSNMRKYEQTKDKAFREKAREAMFKASQVENVVPWSKIRYAQAAGADCIERSELWMASELLGKAVRLIPLASNRGMVPEVLEQRLSSLAVLPAEACSATLAAGKSVDEALELLELGRGVILGYKIDSRSDFTVLKKHAYDKYEELLSVRERINIGLEKVGELPAWESSRRSALKRWEELLQEIRAIPLLRDFLRPLDPKELMKTASHGPIVILNCTSIRSDAIIITQQSLQSIPLDVRYKDLQASVCSMKYSITPGSASQENLADDLRHRKKLMNDLLGSLWESVVRPVTVALGPDLTSTKRGSMPRLWWIRVGLMSLMPIHAAGKWTNNTQEGLADIAISSYIPTIKALKYCREKSEMVNQVSVEKSMLAVSMSTTPDRIALENVTDEVETIARAMEGIPLCHRERPSTAHVLEELRRGPTFVHFACHGETELESPMDSSLLLVRSPIHKWKCVRCELNGGPGMELPAMQFRKVRYLFELHL